MTTALLDRPTATPTSPSVPRATERVEVRPLRGHDEHLVQRVFDGLGQRSRLTPFRTRTARLNPTVRRTLTLTVPGERAAFVALLQGRAVGLGHWVRDESDPGTAELSLAVTDAAQGRGVGRSLMHVLAGSADRQGVDWFRCPAGVDDRRVRSWLAATGARWHDDEVLVHVRTVVARTS